MKSTFNLSILKKPIRDLHKGLPVLMDETSCLKDVIESMRENNLSALLLEQDHNLSGIVSERDILFKVVDRMENLDKVKVKEVMIPGPSTQSLGSNVYDIIECMYQGRFRNVPIIDSSGQLAMLMTISDILDFIFDHLPDEFTSAGLSHDDEKKKDLESKFQLTGEVDETLFFQSIEETSFDKVPILDEKVTLYESIEAMKVFRSGVILFTRKGELSGILTERDILRKVAGKDLSLMTPVRDFFTPNPYALSPKNALYLVINNMYVGGFRNIPIVDPQTNRPLGNFSIKGLFNFLSNCILTENSVRRGA
jgi:CBS domain-containing protein